MEKAHIYVNNNKNNIEGKAQIKKIKEKRRMKIIYQQQIVKVMRLMKNI